MKNLYSIFLISILTLSLAEVVLKVYGVSPLEKVDLPYTRCGSYLWESDDYLGFKFKAGAYTCEINGLEFHVRQLPNDSRYTGRQNDNNTSIHLYGGSITWGHGLSDTMTMAYKLQERLPEYKILNYGVGASGTLQAYLSMKREFERGNLPQLAIYNYASFHNERNTFVWGWKKNWQNILIKKNEMDFNQSFKIPILRNRNFKIQYISEREILFNLPFSKHSVLANVFNNAYHTFKDRRVNSFDVTKDIIVKMSQLCKEYDITFLVAGIYDDEMTYRMLSNIELVYIPVIDISVNLESSKYNLLPYDGHPSEFANEIYANNIFKYIVENTLEEELYN